MTYGDYPDFSTVNNILVVKMRHLGDVLLSTPIYSLLKKRFPHLSIDALVYEEGKNILEGHPAIKNVFGYDRKNKKLPLIKKITTEYSLLKSLKKNSYDLVINLTEGDRGSIITRFCKPLYSVGMTQKKGFLGKKIYTHLIKECKNPRHQVERDLDALRVCGIFPNLDERELFFSVEKKVLESAGDHKDFFLFCPFSRWKFKCLPMGKMKKILSFLEDRGQKVIVCGANDPDEMEMAQELVKGSRAVNLVGKVNIKELGGLMQNSIGVICVDSLALHLSSALKKKVIVFFGPTSEVKWGPWRNPEAFVITKDLPCRPCSMDGCGGSKLSDCLYQIDLSKTFSILEKWIKE